VTDKTDGLPNSFPRSPCESGFPPLPKLRWSTIKTKQNYIRE